MVEEGKLRVFDALHPSLEGWSASASPGSTATLSLELGAGLAALRLDFALTGPTGWAIARRELRAALPAHWVAVLALRGAAARNDLQLKLVDPDGANVWWWRLRDHAFPAEVERRVLRRAGLEFAWGPAGGGEPAWIGAVEVAVAAGRGGAGTLWIEELRLEPREPTPAAPRPDAVRASSAGAGHAPERALEPDPGTSWRPAADDAAPWLELDLGRACEWGGVAVDWEGESPAPACRLLASDDRTRWTLLAQTPGEGDPREWLRSADGEGRFARLEPGCGRGIARVEVVPIELALAPARHAAAQARAAPRGDFPRHLLGEQGYWAVVGGDGDERKGLLGEDGALEVDAEAFTVEPFLWADGRLVSWADAEHSASLEEGDLPIPSVRWQAEGLRLVVTAFASGEPGASVLVARYEVGNTREAPLAARLLLALRPFQVTPAWQGLNLAGAVAPIVRIEAAGARVRVDGAREVVAVSRPNAFGALRSAEGPLVSLLRTGRLPAHARAHDPLGFAEGVLAFDLALPPGAHETLAVAVPLHAASPSPPAGLPRAEAAAWVEARLAEATARWRARLAGVPIELPPAAAHFAESLRASLGWILVNREGPRLQPGPRAYRRAWIRDGSLMAGALLELGFAEEARAFLRWYAPFQLEDGRVPCAVDRRGVDPVVEHDSHGQLVWAVLEVFRHTRDLGFLTELWPRVTRAVDAIARLRAQRTSDAWRGEPAFGLLPESISHEGYAARPVHSYWDDLFAVRALADATEAAAVLDDRAAAERIGALHRAMRRDLCESISRTMERHGIDFLPGSVEHGDLDPASSAIALDPCGGAELPAGSLERTFERYRAELAARRRGERPETYTPYELRNATALLLLGREREALELLEELVADQRPPGWRQWPEVVWRDPRAPRFLGDLPHGWVAACFVRALRRVLAYERASDGALVVAAGVPEAWVRDGAGVQVRGLSTWFGPLSYSMQAQDADRVSVRFGPGLGRPPGGLLVRSPLERPLRGAEVDGRPHAEIDGPRVRLREAPAELILRH